MARIRCVRAARSGGVVIVLRFNRPLSQEALSRIRYEIDYAVNGNKVMVVDDSVDVFVDGDTSGVKVEYAVQDR
jgi:hypoxanthine-guanine phosphoribosyltransferase